MNTHNHTSHTHDVYIITFEPNSMTSRLHTRAAVTVYRGIDSVRSLTVDVSQCELIAQFSQSRVHGVHEPRAVHPQRVSCGTSRVSVALFGYQDRVSNIQFLSRDGSAVGREFTEHRRPSCFPAVTSITNNDAPLRLARARQWQS